MRAWFIGLVLLAAAPARAIEVERLYAPLGGPGGTEVVSGHVLVRFSSASAASPRQVLIRAMGARVASDFPRLGWTVVSVPPGQSVSEALSAWRAVAGVEDAQPNRVYRPNKVPGDSMVSSQYALGNVNAFSAWEYETGTSSLVSVAVIDSGISGSHNDLSAKILTAQSKSFNAADGAVSASNPLVPACNHATRVAGLAAASTNNGLGIAGMSWGAKLISLKIFNDADCDTNCGDLSGHVCGTSDAAVIAALNDVVAWHNSPAAGKIVVNLSLGEAGACPGATQAAITTTLNAGVMIVAATGNDGGNVQTPANCVGVVPVGATDQSNAVAGFSSRGSALALYGLVAPGVNVLTTDINNTYAAASGTSFASPIAAGAAALIWSAKPTLSNAQVRDILRGSAANIGVSSQALGSGPGPRGNVAGAGLLDAFRAMRLAIYGTLADFIGDQKAIAFPNPFRPNMGVLTVTVPLALQGSQTTIKLYTADGELVKSLSGKTWDGKNSEGVPAASGTYIFLVTTVHGAARGRFALIR